PLSSWATPRNRELPDCPATATTNANARPRPRCKASLEDQTRIIAISTVTSVVLFSRFLDFGSHAHPQRDEMSSRAEGKHIDEVRSFVGPRKRHLECCPVTRHLA
ncbi:hypothetical protein M758_7G171300, partial [Ceratodon purpureus]